MKNKREIKTRLADIIALNSIQSKCLLYEWVIRWHENYLTIVKLSIAALLNLSVAAGHFCNTPQGCGPHPSSHGHTPFYAGEKMSQHECNQRLLEAFCANISQLQSCRKVYWHRLVTSVQLVSAMLWTLITVNEMAGSEWSQQFVWLLVDTEWLLLSVSLPNVGQSESYVSLI